MPCRAWSATSIQASAEMCERKVVEILPDVTLRELLLSFQEVLARATCLLTIMCSASPCRSASACRTCWTRIRHGQFAEFTTLFSAEEGRMGVVVTFLAILELIRESVLDIVQSEPFAPIHVKARGGDRPDRDAPMPAKHSRPRRLRHEHAWTHRNSRTSSRQPCWRPAVR
jgi:segregation and condensation protein A